jgi:heme/copper-type cytochrome/quinol oxidase subunit 4
MDYPLPPYLYYINKDMHKPKVTPLNTKKIIISWIYLIILTLTSVLLGTDMLYNESSHTLFIFLVLFIVFLKGQQIIDIFMELKHAPKRWRALLMSYVIIIPIVICTIYLV